MRELFASAPVQLWKNIHLHLPQAGTPNKSTHMVSNEARKQPLFFSCDCLSTIMVRSVNCLNPIYTRYAVQVRLIGAKPILQVRRWNRQTGPLVKKSLNNNQTTKPQATATRAQPATATRNPPARLPVARAKERTANNKRLHEETNQGTSERTLKPPRQRTYLW